MQNTYLCGTVRANRKFFPKDMVRSTREANRMARGGSDWRQSGELVATVWKDNKAVYQLTSFYEPEREGCVVSRRQKNGTLLEFPCPPSIKAYGQYMGGVDRLDQNTRQDKRKKSMRWYRRIERKLMEASIYNAYILEGCISSHQVEGQRKRDLLSFRLDLAHQLVGEWRDPRKKAGRPRSENNLAEARLDGLHHWPVPSGSSDRVCEVCNHQHRLYLQQHPEATYSENPHKRRKTSIKCNKCEKAFCVRRDSTCFMDYHTKVEFWH